MLKILVTVLYLLVWHYFLLQGRKENYPLTIESTFEYPIQLENLSVYPEDPRFQFLKPDFLPKLPSKEKVHVRVIYFVLWNSSICFLVIFLYHLQINVVTNLSGLPFPFLAISCSLTLWCFIMMWLNYALVWKKRKHSDLPESYDG